MLFGSKTGEGNWGSRLRGKFFYLFVCLLSLLIFFTVATRVRNLGSLKTAGANFAKVFNPSVLADPGYYTGLPVASVKSYTVPNAWGTVIFIPQYHQNPGSSVGEQKNDSAQTAQEEIYQVLKFLTAKPNLSLVMVEGELYGEVPAQKINRVAQDMKDRNELIADERELSALLKKESVDPKLEESIHKKITAKANEVDRKIILQGAPFKLKAEGSHIDLFGMENSATLEESKIVVRNYIYLQDRMDEVKSLSYKQNNSLNFSQDINDRGFSTNGNWLGLLQQLMGTESANYEFRALESLASTQGKEKLLELLKQTEATFQRLSGGNKQPTAIADGSSRADNPYKNVTDQRELQSMMTDAEKQIDEVIVKRRNYETAENFAKALREKRETAGVLQFGAGHEEGLTQELNKLGLSVIVVTSEEVSRRNKS